jgi:hypothetical protein
MIQIDKDTYRAQAARYEAEASALPEGDPKREQLLRDAASLRADIDRGATAGLGAMGMKCGEG